MRRTLLAIIIVTLVATESSAQIVVTDPAVTLRNSITAVLKEYLLNVQRDQHAKLRPRILRDLTKQLRCLPKGGCRAPWSLQGSRISVFSCILARVVVVWEESRGERKRPARGSHPVTEPAGNLS